MAEFDYLGAKQAGASDEEIQSFLKANGTDFDLIGAKQAGATDDEISTFLKSQPVKKKEVSKPTAQVSSNGTTKTSQSSYNLDLSLPKVNPNPNNKALPGLGQPFKPEIALKSINDERKFINAKTPTQTNFQDYNTVINDGIKGQNKFDNTTQILTSQNVIPQQAKKEVQQLQQKQQVVKDAKKDTRQNILAVIPELADAKNTDEAISTILKSDMKNNLDYWQQFDDEALLGNDENTLNDFLVSNGLKNQDRELYLKEQASSNPKYGYEYEYNKIGSLFKAVKQRADDYDTVLKQKFGDNYMEIAKQGNSDILNDQDFNKFRQLREKQNELSTKANGLINDSRYFEVKSSREKVEKAQQGVDERAKNDKIYKIGDELNYIGNKLAYGAGHVVKMIAELPSLATSIDKGYDWTDKIADWGNRFSDNLIESIPVSTDKKTGVFNKVADVDGYKVFVDESGEPIDVRDKNNFKVPLSVSQSVVEKFSSNPQTYKTRNEMNSGALVDNGLNTMIDMGIMILGTKGAGMVGAGEKLQKLTDMGIAYQQTKRDVFNDAIKKGLDPRNADLFSNIIGVAAGTSSMLNPMEFNIAKGAGLFNLLKTDGLNAAKLALIKDGKLSVKDYAKEFVSGAIKNTIGENIEELGIESTTQAIANNHFNNQISETDMVDSGLDDRLHILDKQGLETFLITAGSSFLMTPIEINSQTQFNQQEAMKMAIENPKDFAKIKELQLKQGQISQQQFDNETKIYNDVSKTYNAVKDDVKEELQPQLLALLTKKSNLSNKISEIKDEVLSKPYKDQLEQVNKGIESISIGKNADKSLVAPIEQSETLETPSETIEELQKNRDLDNKEIDDKILAIDKNQLQFIQDQQKEKLEKQRAEQNDYYDSKIKILAESTAKDGSSTITKVETEIANKINKGQELTAEETDYYNAQKDSIDKLVTVNKSPIIPINETVEVEKKEIVLPPPTPQVVAPAELDEQQITEQLNEVLNDKTTPTPLVDTEQEQNISERLPSEYQNNQGVQQIDGIGQDVSNESEVPVEQKQAEVIKKANPRIAELPKKKKEVPTEKVEEGVGETESIKNRSRKDLFPDESEFSDVIGGSGKNSKISSYKEVNGIGISEYKNPDSGVVDVIMTGTSDNDYVGYVRIYENGKPTERWTSKMENKSGNKANFKTMISEVKNLLPANHEYTESTNISLDGIRVYANNLTRGYEILTDKDGNPITNNVELNGATLQGLKDAKSDRDVSKLYNKRTGITRDEFNKIREKVNELLPGTRLLFNEANGSVIIKLPVLKSKETAKSNPTDTPEVSKPVSEIAKTPISKTETTAILDEIKSKNLTHVKGKNMGENQALGTFISTEKGNRYETADNKAESVEVDIKNPLVVENDLGLVGKRTEILNNNKDKFTKEDAVDYQELPDGKITLDDLNDAGIKKLAKITTEKLQADGYDGIYFKESKTQEGELVVFDKEKVKFKEQTPIADETPKLKAKEKQDLVKSLNKEQVKEFIKLKTPQEKESYLINLRDKEQKLKNDKHDRLVSLMREYNSTASNRTTRKQEIRQSMLKLSSDLGYSIKAKEGDKLEVLNSNGKLIRKINIPTDEKPATAENIEKVKELTHWFNWNGNDLDFHIDAVKLGLTWQNIRTALADINAGKTESTNINRVANAINEYGNMESLPLVRGFGGNYERLDVTGDDLFWAQKVNEATELLSGYEYNEAEREQALKDLSETDEKEFEQYSDLYSKFVNQDGTLNWEEALKYEQANKTTTDESAKGQGSSNIIGDGKNSQQLQKEKRSAAEIKSELKIKEAELKKLEEKQSQLKKQLEQNLKENQLDLLQGAKPQAMFDDKVEQQKIAEKSKSDIENKRKEIAKLNEELDNINQEEIPFQSTNKKFIPISKSKFNELLDKLKKAFPNVKVELFGKNDFDNARKELEKRGIVVTDTKTKDGTIYGFKTPDGKVFLNYDAINANTPIHEFGHIWQSVFPNEFAKGISLLVQSPQGRELINEIRKNPAYKGKSITEIQAEALVTAIGNKGETIFNSNPTLYNKFKQWLNDLFAKIGDKLGIKNLSPDDKFDMFTKKVVGELLGGKVLDSKVGTETKSGDVDLQFKPDELTKKVQELRDFELTDEEIRDYLLEAGNTKQQIDDALGVKEVEENKDETKKELSDSKQRVAERIVLGNSTLNAVKEHIVQQGYDKSDYDSKQIFKDVDELINKFGIEKAESFIDKIGDVGLSEPHKVVLQHKIAEYYGNKALSDETLTEEERKEAMFKSAQLFLDLSQQRTDAGRGNAILAQIYLDSDIYFTLPMFENKMNAIGAQLSGAEKIELENLQNEIKELRKENTKLQELAKKEAEQQIVDDITTHLLVDDLIIDSKIKDDLEVKNAKSILAKGFEDIARMLSSIAMAQQVDKVKFKDTILDMTKATMTISKIGVKKALKSVIKAIKNANQNIDEKLLEDAEKHVLSQIKETDTGIKKKNKEGISKDELIELIEQGADTMEKMVEAIRNKYYDGDKSISDKQIRDEITNYGNSIRQSQTQVEEKLSEIKSLMLLQSKLEDAENNVAPKKTGFIRDKDKIAVREKRRELAEAMKKLTVTLSEDDIAGLNERKLTQIANKIEEVQKVLDGYEKIKNKANFDYNDAVKKKQQELDDLMSSQKALLHYAKENLTNLVAKYQDKLDKKQYSKNPTLNKLSITDSEYQKLKNQLEAKKEQLKSERDNFRNNNADYLLENRQKQIDRQIVEIDNLLAGIKVRKTSEQIKAEKDRKAGVINSSTNQTALDKLKENQKVLEAKKEQWERKVIQKEVEIEKAKQTWLQKLGINAMSISRTLTLGFTDIGWLGVQGGYFARTKPHLFAKALKESFKGKLSEEAFNQWKRDLKSNPFYETMIKAGLRIPSQSLRDDIFEQEFRESGFTKLLGKNEATDIVNKNARLSVKFLANLRIQVFQKMYNGLTDSQKADKEVLEKLADYVNSRSGAGQVIGEDNKRGLNKWWGLLTSARNTSAMLQQTYIGMLYGLAKNYVRNKPLSNQPIIARQLVNDLLNQAVLFSGLYLSYLVANGLSGDDDEWNVETSPFSTNFLKLKNKEGDRSYFDMGGMTALNVATLRLLTTITNAFGTDINNLKDYEGKYSKVGLKDYSSKTGLQILSESIFNRTLSLLAPIKNPFTAKSDKDGNYSMYGKTYTPTEFKLKMLMDMFIPMNLPNIYNDITDKDVNALNAIVNTVLNVIGVSNQNQKYDRPEDSTSPQVNSVPVKSTPVSSMPIVPRPVK